MPPERAAGALTRVEVLADGDTAAWDAYVRAHPRGTFFHLSAWRGVVRETLGHGSRYLLARRGDAIVGVLPLGHVKSRLFGNALISVPFCVYGGVLADDEAAGRALLDAALEHARAQRVDWLELREAEAPPPSLAAAGAEESLYVRFRKTIHEDPEDNLKAIPRKQRAMVRKGMQAGLDWVIDPDVERFFALYSESVRNLGTPVLPKRWYAAVKRAFGDDCDVLTVLKDGRPVSSVLSYYFRDEVLPYYGGGGADARALKANDFMYHALMTHAAARGCTRFDYGRSKKGSGSYSFKKNWGFEPEDLHYQVHLVEATDPPALNPNNPKYRMAIAAWQKLPLGVSRRLGPLVAKYLA